MRASSEDCRWFVNTLSSATGYQHGLILLSFHCLLFAAFILEFALLHDTASCCPAVLGSIVHFIHLLQSMFLILYCSPGSV